MKSAKKIGYYPGDDPKLVVKGKNRQAQKVVIKAHDVIKLSQELKGMDMNENAKLKEERLALHQKSKQMIASWDNTILGQRRKKLEAREARLRLEEEARQKLSDEWNREEEQRRQDALERAKWLQFKSNDKVIDFHGKVLLHHVLKERDIQIELKKKRKEIEAIEEMKTIKVQEQKLQKEAEKEKLELEKSKLTKKEFYQAQVRQHQIKLEKERAEMKTHLAEGVETRQIDKDYNRRQQILEQSKADHRMKLFQELVKMEEEKLRLKDAEKLKEQREQEKIDDWTKRKEKQVMTKKKVEAERFEEHLRLREEIGQHQAKLLQKKEQNLDEIIEQAVAEREERFRIQSKKLAEQKEQQTRDILDSFQKKKEENEAARLRQKEEDAVWLAKYEAMKSDVLQSVKNENEKKLLTGKELQAFHKKQMAEKQQSMQQSSDLASTSSIQNPLDKVADNQFFEYVDAFCKQYNAENGVPNGKCRPLESCLPREWVDTLHKKRGKEGN